MPLTFDQLRETNVKRCNTAFNHHGLYEWTPTDYGCALAGEVGEACNFVKKLRRLDGRPATTELAESRDALRYEIGKELADVVTYCDLLAARLHIDLGQAVAHKFNEVSARVGSPLTLST